MKRLILKRFRRRNKPRINAYILFLLFFCWSLASITLLGYDLPPRLIRYRLYNKPYRSLFSGIHFHLFYILSSGVIRINLALNLCTEELSAYPHIRNIHNEVAFFPLFSLLQKESMDATAQTEPQCLILTRALDWRPEMPTRVGGNLAGILN